MEIECPECITKIEIPNDALEGEIVSCPDCGLDLEIKVSEGKITLEKLSIEKEDWGE